MLSFSRVSLRVLVVFIAAALAGCGGGGTSEPMTSVSGQLLENGKPLVISTKDLPPGDTPLRVRFVQLDADGKSKETFPAIVSLDTGEFKLSGKNGSSIPAGKYRITVERGATGTPDFYKNKFNGNNSPLTTEISAGKAVKVTVDVGTGKVTVE